LAAIGIRDFMIASAIEELISDYIIKPDGDQVCQITYEIARQLEEGLHNRFPEHVFKAGRQLNYYHYGEEPDWEPDHYFKGTSRKRNSDERAFLDSVHVLGEGCSIYDIAKHCKWDRRKAAKIGDKLDKEGTIRTENSERNHHRVRLVYLNNAML